MGDGGPRRLYRARAQERRRRLGDSAREARQSRLLQDGTARRPRGRRERERHAHRGLALRPAVLVGAAVALAVVIVLVALALGGGSAPRRPVATTRAVVSVLIPEGETRAQIAEIAHARGLSGSYLEPSRQFAGFSPQQYGAPPSTPNLEGFLFPATYEVFAGDSASILVSKQLEAFSERFGAEFEAAAHALHETPYQLLIVASMIEREAQVPHDRPLIAAVIYNRLQRGMPLGIDATVRYALRDYTQPLTEAQLHTRSPYNTRLHAGLPPTPISNPGLASLDAAAHPANVGYLYYVAAPDGCGEHVFSTSYAQFLRDSAAYQQALAANGGRVPACRKR